MKAEVSPGSKWIPAGNHATGWLKVIALVFMIIDHMGCVVFPQIPEMRVWGRLAFPIYCWCLVVGFYYTRNVWKYMIRLGQIFLVSQPVYAIALNHIGTPPAGVHEAFAWIWKLFLNGKPNILLTLMLGLMALWGIREKKIFSHIWAPLAAILLAGFLKADYGWKGVLFIILLYLVQSTKRGIVGMMVAYFLFWGSGYSVSYLFPLPIPLRDLPTAVSQPLSAFMRLETYGLLSLPVIIFPFKKDLKLPAWVSYGLYPAHLVLILLLKLIFAG